MGCSPEIKGDADRFKKGVFEIPAGDGYGKTTIIRRDSLQIEEYEKTYNFWGMFYGIR